MPVAAGVTGLLDVNVLVALVVPEHEHHSTTLTPSSIVL
jgi:hypothetical protein